MKILNGMYRMIGKHVAVTDIHAAGEGGLPVNDEDFAMITKIDGRHAPRREQGCRQKFCKGDTRMFQFVSDGRPGVARAGGINQNADGDTALECAAESSDESPSALVVVENVDHQ